VGVVRLANGRAGTRSTGGEQGCEKQRCKLPHGRSSLVEMNRPGTGRAPVEGCPTAVPRGPRTPLQAGGRGDVARITCGSGSGTTNVRRRRRMYRAKGRNGRAATTTKGRARPSRFTTSGRA